jgi:NADH-quinone oxidoreductase subunit G
MVEIEIDGRKVEVAEGSTVMVAAHQLGVYVPHFCYHKKLSIAANCRMCLVEVEKAPKPLPACATPVTPGMKVQTRSEKALKAQQGVMEFLLINHPLDCPICDQGGECQLQDLAVGYGNSASRYTEEKRVVFHKSVGPLISAEEMSRCIHCTRCVRFGQEVAGVMELGMAGRGEHSEIMSFVGRGVHSELSGNMIDVCPVGALTSKPFRYSARTWELSRRRSVAAHDSLGSNIVVQIKGNTVMRVLPFENESINECWLSDRDRFSYEGLNAPDRLTAPLLRQDGQWREVDWPTALQYAAHALGSVRKDHGAEAIGALATPQSTLEELHLMARLMRGLGSENIDYRARVGDSRLASALGGAPWLGRPISEINALERILIVGSFLRKDHPLLAARIRAAVKRGARLGVVHSVAEDLLVPVAARALTAPSRWASLLAATRVAVLQARQLAVPAELSSVVPDEPARAMAALLLEGERKALFLGNAVAHQHDALEIALQAQALADLTQSTLGWLVEGANGTGGALAGALPGASGLDAQAMVRQPRKAYLLMNMEPSLDHGQPALAMSAMRAAESVIALTAYRSPDLLEVADCLLPIAPFTETSGSFVNAAGSLQSFNGVVRPLGEARPAWKVLRVLGNLLELPGFNQDSPEQVRAQAVPADLSAGLSSKIQGQAAAPHASPAGGLERIADVPIHFADAIVRRATSLQATRDAALPAARMSDATLAQLGVQAGQAVRIAQAGGHEVLLTAQLDPEVVDGVVRVAAAHACTAGLASIGGAISVERA